VPLTRLDVRFELRPSLAASPGASIYAQAACVEIPNYGRASFYTGICNQQGNLAASGTFITGPYPPAGRAASAPPGLSVRSISVRAPTGFTPGAVTVRLALARGARYLAAGHRIGLLIVDQAGQPLGLDYTDQRTSTDGAGNISSVSLAIPPGVALPRYGSLYVISDVFPLDVLRLP
jgi:hypothetical protein